MADSKEYKHLTKICLVCLGTGVKLGGIGVCDVCIGSCRVPITVDDIPADPSDFVSDKKE